MKICKICERKEKGVNEIHMISSYVKDDNTRRKVFNNINEADDIKLQAGKKVD